MERKHPDKPPGTFRNSRKRLFLRILLHTLVSAAVLFLLLKFIPFLGSIDNYAISVILILILSLLQAFIWPVLIRGFLKILHMISPVFMVLIFPVVSIFLLTLFILIASWISEDITINGFWPALVLALFMTIISSIFASIFSTDDETVIYRFTLKRIGYRLIDKGDIGKPGIVFLEIDGLGKAVLEAAMRKGKAPNMKRWLDTGTHRLTGWHSDLSSQTSAAQAGILHGNNRDIPAFRWYDKQLKKVVVSSSLGDVSQIEQLLSNGEGLLCDRGAARSCLLSGDAEHVIMTASRVHDMTSADFTAYYLNPSSFLRSISLMVWDWVLEKRAAWIQRIRDEKPRVNRGGIYFILRSFMTVFLRDISIFTLKGDMYAGVPSVYVTLAGYDEVAHHSGIMRQDTLEVLRKLDREFGKLEKLLGEFPRKYKLVVLSDHGQTQGMTFKDRYNESVEDLVRRLLGESNKPAGVSGYKTKHESAYYIDAAFKDSGIADKLMSKPVHHEISKSQQTSIGIKEDMDIVVLSSGNLGLVSFTRFDHRLTLEEIEQFYPDLLDKLVAHPGIGLVMVNSARKGGLVRGKTGRVWLTNGKVEGKNPLTNYGLDSESFFSRENSFPNAPDILLISTYWKDADEVAAFEEQVGSHGGIGGEQSRPFIFYPSEFEIGDSEIKGAEEVYRIFKHWTEKTNGGTCSDEFSP